jgi:hypothetical protein
MFREVKAQFGKVDIFVANARPRRLNSSRRLRCNSGIRLSIPKPKHFLIAVRETSALMPEEGRIIAMTYA